jgi:hypothetical protein
MDDPLVHCVACAVSGVDCVDQTASRIPTPFDRLPLISFLVFPFSCLRRLQKGEEAVRAPVSISFSPVSARKPSLTAQPHHGPCGLFCLDSGLRRGRVSISLGFGFRVFPVG